MARDLRIQYDGDTSGVSRALSKMSSEHSRFGKMLGGIGRAGAQAFKGMAIGAGALGAAAAVGMGAVIKKGISMNAELETAELQFTTLMGSAEAATKHVEGLFKFAAATPFETGPILEASRHLLVMGGEALNTQDNLRRVGDAAAAVSQPIEEVGFWVGRAYAMIQGGKPFGEAAMRLSEMGIISPQVRDEMEGLQKSGASAAEVWAVLESRLDGFNGAMLKQADSWKGLMSTISDVIAMESAKMTQPLFDALRGTAKELVTFATTPAWDAIAERGRTAFDALGQGLVNVTTAFREGGIAGVLDLVSGGIEKMAEQSPLFAALSTVLQALGNMFMALWPAVEPLLPVLAELGRLTGIMVATVAPFLPQIAELAVRLLSQLMPALTAIFTAFQPLIPVLMKVVSKLLPPLIDLIWALTPIIVSLAVPVMEVVKAFLPLLPVLAKLVQSLIPPLVGLIKAVAPLIVALAPIITQLVKAFMPLIPPLTEIVISLLKPLIPIIKALTPIITTVAEVIGVILGNAVKLVEPHLRAFGMVIERIAGFISTVVGWIGRMAKALSSIKIPDWLMPGSPSPLEKTLWNTVAAMKQLSRVGPPAFAGMPSGGAGRIGGAGGAVVVNVAGSVITERELAASVRNELLRVGASNPDIFGGRA